MSSFSFFLIICASALFHSFQFSIAGSNETDRLALLEIKAKITHDPLGIMNSWNDSLKFCEWHGVICGHRHKRVTALDLQSLKLTGILSPWVGNLSFLQDLQLQNNSFGGTIPSEISHLHRLETLFIFNNSFGGEIPLNISSCSSLIRLHLYGNRFIGSIPNSIGRLANLLFLSLSENNLTGTIPSSLGNLSSLNRLSIGRTNLVGRIPSSLGRLKNLASFLLPVNNLVGMIPPSIFNLSSLVKIELSNNYLEGSLPSDIGNTLPNLQYFSMCGNLYSGHIPASISNASYLNTLQLCQNQFHGPVPSLHNIERLQNLAIYDNFLGTGQATDLNFVSSLSNATMLNEFDIGGNNFGGIFPKTICNSTTLSFLQLGVNKIAGVIPDCIGNLANLEIFDTRENQLSGIIPSSIGRLQNLFNLHFGNNQLSGYIPSSIGNLSRLTIFASNGNSLQGHIPSTLGNCVYLIGLDLSQNNLSGSIPSEVVSLTSLSILLSLSHNHLTGSLPAEVGKLKNLVVLDIAKNMLSGEIPSTISSCVELIDLYMNENLFHGKIPPALETLKGLLQIDLSNNNLEGEVPVDGVFSNATAVFLSENSGLCGGIPELKLPRCNFTSNTHKRRERHRNKKMIVAILSGFFGVILLLVFLVLLYIFWKRDGTKKPNASDVLENFPNLSYHTLLKVTNGFSSESLIGRGTFGSVYKGVLDEYKKTVAIKVFKLQNHGATKSFMAECGILRNIRHRNLLKVITACSSVDYQGRDFKGLVYEYMENGSLDDWLHPSNPITGVEDANNISRHLNLRQRLDIAVDIAFALDYLHHHCGASIVHCDLKPSNVLLDDEMVAHVGDFGLAKFLFNGTNDSHANQSSSIGIRGTIGYAPPEYGVGNEVSTSGDVYSFGILLLEMFTGKRPTNDMFKGGLTLHGFVREALPGNAVEILDHVLLEDIDSSDSSLLLEALTSILGIALSCSTEIPGERLDMSDVAAKLSSIKNKLLGTRLQQRRRVQAGTQG